MAIKDPTAWKDDSTFYMTEQSVTEQADATEQAFEHYDRAVALAKDDARVYCDRSYAYFRHGDFETALADANRALNRRFIRRCS